MKKASFAIILVIVVFVVPLVLFAQSGHQSGNQVITLPNPLGTTATANTLIHRIVDWLLALGAPVAAIMIIYGAFQMLFAGGNPDNFTKGRNTILYAAVGYGIIFIGWGLVSVIEGILTTNP